MARSLKDTIMDKVRDEDRKYLDKFGDKLSEFDPIRPMD